MLDKISGIPTQIRQLEKRLKEMDGSKVKPAVIKEITDTLKNLKDLLKEKMEKREQRKKDKESKTSKEEVKIEADVVTEAASRCALCGDIEFATYPEYKAHMETEHAAPKEYAPMDHQQKKDIVKNFEKKLGPAIVSEKEVIPAKTAFPLDHKVKPIRGEKSIGRVMRHDGPEDLCYVAWDEGPLKDRDGFGGYYSHELTSAEEPKQEVTSTGNPTPPDIDIIPKETCPCETDMSVYCPMCKNSKTSDLKSKYDELLKDLKDERQEAWDKHDHVWVARLDSKIKEMEQKMAEKFGNEKEAIGPNALFECSNCKAPLGPTTQSHLEHGENGEKHWSCNKKEAGAQNDKENLTVMDHTPPRANVTMDEGGKDSHDEFQDEWAMPAGTEVTSAKGVPNSVFNAETAPTVVGALNTGVKAPYVNAYSSSLGGAENTSILLTMSLDPKNTWANGILENSRYVKLHIYNDGTVEEITGHYGIPKFRKRTVTDVNHLIQVLNTFSSIASEMPKVSSLKEEWAVEYFPNTSDKMKIHKGFTSKAQADAWVKSENIHDKGTDISVYKIASLNKKAIMVNVFKRDWEVIPVYGEGMRDFKGYDVKDDAGRKVMHIAPQNGAQMNKEMLEYAIGTELTKGLKQARLTTNVAFLKKGSKVYILATDKKNKRVKFADLSQGIRGWVPESKVKIVALDPKLKPHGNHSDAILGISGTEVLLECPANSGQMSWVNMQPPATPEALNDLESAKDCPDCHGNFVGAEGQSCPTCGRFSVKASGSLCKNCKHTENSHWNNGGTCSANLCNCRKYENSQENKEALMTAIPQSVTDQDAYLNNPPVGKKAAGCDQCDATMINGVFCHETGCPKATKKCRHNHRPSECSVCSDEMDVESSLNKQADEASEELAYERAMDRLDKRLMKHEIHQEEYDIEVKKLKKQIFPNENLYRDASLNKQAHIRHEDGKWVVYNHDYKKKLGTYDTKEEALKRLRQIEYFKNASVRPFSKKAEVLTDPYQSLTTHITDMKSRMSQVQEKLQSAPVPKTAGEEDNSTIDLPELLEDLTMGIALLETKLGGDDIDPELHAGIENLENLLWSIEARVGITPKLSEHEKEEPEHKQIVEDLEKEAGSPLCSVEGCENKADSVADGKRYCYTHSWGKKDLKEAASTSSTTTTTTTSPSVPVVTAPNSTPQTDDAPSNAPDDASPNCAICGGLTFADYAGYQNHMEYSHASDIMPTTPDQRRKSPVASKKVAIDVTVTDETTDETITNDPNATPATPAPVVAPTIQNVQPTDQDNLEVPIAKPSSPPAPGQIWVFNSDPAVMAYVSMPDPAAPDKTI